MSMEHVFIVPITFDDKECFKEDSCKNCSLLCAEKIGNNQNMWIGGIFNLFF